MQKLLMTTLSLLLISGCTPPKPPAISGSLEPVNKHRAIAIAADEDPQQQPKASKKTIKK